MLYVTAYMRNLKNVVLINLVAGQQWRCRQIQHKYDSPSFRKRAVDPEAG